MTGTLSRVVLNDTFYSVTFEPSTLSLAVVTMLWSLFLLLTGLAWGRECSSGRRRGWIHCVVGTVFLLGCLLTSVVQEGLLHCLVSLSFNGTPSFSFTTLPPRWVAPLFGCVGFLATLLTGHLLHVGSVVGKRGGRAAR